MVEADVGIEQDISTPVREEAADLDAPAFAALTPANDVGTAEDATIHESAPVTEAGDTTGEAFAAEEASAEIAGNDDAAPVFKPDLRSGPVRFVWRTDAEGRSGNVACA